MLFRSMQENAGLQREGMREQGANAREAGRNALTAEELGLKREAQGFQTRAAKRLEDLQSSYLAAKTPEERATFARQIQDLSGKGEGNLRDNFMAVGGGQEWDAQAGVMRNVPQRLVDLRTGREVGVSGQQQGQGGLPKVTTPQDLAALKSGTRFVDSNGVERIKK